MWSDGGPVDPSTTVDEAINGGFSWLEIECSRCKARRDVALASLRRVRHYIRPRRLVCAIVEIEPSSTTSMAGRSLYVLQNLAKLTER